MLFINKKFIVLLILNAFYYFSTAQTVVNSINLYGNNFPEEKIHIHFDKEVYLPGETIWFKAYLFEENLPGTRSTNFYASLYDETGKLIQQQLCPVFGSTTTGYFQLPDSLPGRQLLCRAYTSWMLNFDSSFLYTKAIRLINNNAKDDKNKTQQQTSLHFFPEGGDVIEGIRNTIAFKANYSNGLPFQIKGMLKKQETGEELMPINSVHDGMGRFDIETQPGEKYYVQWTDDKGIQQQTYLPLAKTTGVSLKLVQQKNKLIYNIVNKLPNDSLHVLMYMYQKVFYTKDLSVSEALPFTGYVPTNALPAGIMQLTVFDAFWQPVAERIAFINNNNYSIEASISNKQTSTAKRSKNVIEIAVSDTIPANMSLSITDADLNSDESNTTIVTDFLLSGNVKGYIHNVAYYFSSDKDAAANLDLVMLTHGWRRYNWAHIKSATMPKIKYGPDDYLMIYGQVNKELLAKTDKEELINLIIKTKDSTQNFYQLKPDKNGFIKKGGIVFYDTARLYYSFKKNKDKNAQVSFSNLTNTILQPDSMYETGKYLAPDTTGIVFNQYASLFTYYNKINKNSALDKEKTLQTVVVKSGGWHNWKNNPLLKMDEKYTSGVFRGGATSETFDVLHDENAWGKQDIYEYMVGKVSGIIIGYNGGKHFVLPDSPRAVLPKINLFIDENEADDYQISQLNMDDIAYIKYFMHSYGRVAADQQKYPTLAIYLKKGDDLISRHSQSSDQKMIKVAGYSPQKEFYSPDYSQSNTTRGTDARTTLLWVPYILTDKNNIKLPVTFFNNDFSTRFRITLEGINDEGRMIHIEKIIE